MDYLKPFLVDKQKYDLFKEYLDACINKEHERLESATDPIQIHRSQGMILAFKRLYKLRDDMLKGS